MSSIESTSKRKDLLDYLRAKQQSSNSSTSASTSRPQAPSSMYPPINPNRSPMSPEPTILVPSSSSPIAPMGGPSSAAASAKFFPAPSHRVGGGTLIPSSNVANRQQNGQWNSGTTRANGTPLSILNAIKRRPDASENGISSSGVSPATGTSTPIRSTTNGSSTSDLANLSDFSPSSPQPLSRLKARYTDESPVKVTSSSVSSTSGAALNQNLLGAGNSSTSTSSRSTIVQAAKLQHTRDEHNLLQKLRKIYPTVSSTDLIGIVRRNVNDHEQAMREANSVKRKQDSIAAGSMPLSPHLASTSSLNIKQFQYKPMTTMAVPAVHPAVNRSVNGTTASPPVSRVAKPKKNEKSTIYAHRDKNAKKKRHDDDDDDEESDAGSEFESNEEWSGDEGAPKPKKRKYEDDVDAEGEALRAFNEADAAVLTGTIACSDEQAAKIIQFRPYEDPEDVRVKLSKAKGVSFKLFEQYAEIMEGYVQIDNCLNRCEAIAKEISSTLTVWKGAATSTSSPDSVTGTPRSDGLNDVKVDVAKVSELLLRETDVRRKKILQSYIRTQPGLLSEGTVLKDYQLLGINWLKLLYTRKIGCILADEMGLGKTIQVIAFLAHLKETGNSGPHMIFVPASTLENWTREFDRFAPEIDVQTYYGSQAERAELRDDLKRKYRSGKLEVVLASYTQVTANDDLAFFRKKIQFETCIYDEGHALKNFATKRYNDLLSIKPNWRLLLTGTPLQNNLQELVSLLMFIHKDIFTEAETYLRAIFKVQAQGHVNLLSQQRTSRARTMLTPFVLRRRKTHVLTLPPKIETVEHCDMTSDQARLYRETLRRSRKVIQEMSAEALDDAILDEVDETKPKKSSTNASSKSKKAKSAAADAASGPGASSANIIMDLRKAASHPLLFRRHYNATKLKAIARRCLMLPQWCDSNYDYIVEDLEVMSDAEIHKFVSSNDGLESFALNPKVFLEGGKVLALKAHLDRCKKEKKRVLLFSQFTMILDILEVALDYLKVRFIRLDGQTKTDERQGLVDEFNDDVGISVFLLSTKAGGVGINLTAASVVVIFDQDFNPHNDRQAADRAYRIGQEKPVEVIKLISKDSIDEDILSIGTTKLQLDDAVGGGEQITSDGVGGPTAEGVGAKDDQTAKEVKKSLLSTLRNKFEADGDSKAEEDAKFQKMDEEDEPIDISGDVRRNGSTRDVAGNRAGGSKGAAPAIKRARGSTALKVE